MINGTTENHFAGTRLSLVVMLQSGLMMSSTVVAASKLKYCTLLFSNFRKFEEFILLYDY